MNTKQKKFFSLSDQEEQIGKHVVDAAFKVHYALGPGLLESVYETCFCHELAKHGLNFQRQVAVPIEYDGIFFEEAFCLDVIVEDLVICELKAMDLMLPVYQAQLLSYLKLKHKSLGYLINFHVPLIKDGIHRFVF